MTKHARRRIAGSGAAWFKESPCSWNEKVSPEKSGFVDASFVVCVRNFSWEGKRQTEKTKSFKADRKR